MKKAVLPAQYIYNSFIGLLYIRTIPISIVIFLLISERIIPYMNYLNP